MTSFIRGSSGSRLATRDWRFASATSGWRMALRLATRASLLATAVGDQRSVINDRDQRFGIRDEGLPMERTIWERIGGTGEQLLAQLKRLVAEGNVRRVVVKQAGKTIAEFPLTAGVIGAVIAPVAAAIGALSALIADCTIEVEKTVPDTESTPVQ
jgi:hypothetical protein